MSSGTFCVSSSSLAKKNVFKFELAAEILIHARIFYQLFAFVSMQVLSRLEGKIGEGQKLVDKSAETTAMFLTAQNERNDISSAGQQMQAIEREWADFQVQLQVGAFATDK